MTSSLGSSDMSRSGSLELTSALMSQGLNRNGSTDSRRNSVDTTNTSPDAITPSTSNIDSGALSTESSSPAPWSQSSVPAHPELNHAASFPMSAVKNEKGGVPHSAFDPSEMTSMKSHADHLSMGIDDSNIEAVSPALKQARAPKADSSAFYRCATMRIRRDTTCLAMPSQVERLA